jgi:hypothetical protein
MTHREGRTHPPPKPNFPRPSRDYNQSDWMNFMRQLQQSFDDIYFPSVLRGGELFLNGIATRGAGLPPGYVFEDSGVLKIVRVNDIYADSFGLTLSVGSVSVST